MTPPKEIRSWGRLKLWVLDTITFFPLKSCNWDKNSSACTDKLRRSEPLMSAFVSVNAWCLRKVHYTVNRVCCSFRNRTVSTEWYLWRKLPVHPDNLRLGPRILFDWQYKSYVNRQSKVRDWFQLTIKLRCHEYQWQDQWRGMRFDHAGCHTYRTWLGKRLTHKLAQLGAGRWRPGTVCGFMAQYGLCWTSLEMIGIVGGVCCVEEKQDDWSLS